MLLGRLDADLPTGQLRGETGVLPFLADGERQLVVMDERDGGLVLLTDDLHIRRNRR